MKYGLLEDLQEFTAYILGKSVVPYIYYNESGNWEEYLPKFEKQRTDDNSETSACTVFASINQIETFIRMVYGYEPNYSERFIYNLVPVNPAHGADPQATHETIRANGLIDEQDLPMTHMLSDYTDKSDITGSLRAKGQLWLKKHDYKHEWLWSTGQRPENYIEVLRDALKTSPIAVSVSAWNKVGDVYVSNQGSVNNHYCLLYAIDDEGYPLIYDTYEYNKKKLSKDHNIRRAKRIWIGEQTKSSMRRHISLLELILNKLMSKKTLLQVCQEALGTDASPEDAASDDVGCVDTVTTLLRLVRPETPHMLSTARFNEWLKDPKNGYEPVLDGIQSEDIIISPTTGAVTGHVGIIMNDGLIGSNNSAGPNKGRFTQNYTMNSWMSYFRMKRKLSVYIYRKKV